MFKIGIELTINPKVVSKSIAGAVKKDESQASSNVVGDENTNSLLVLEDLVDSSFSSLSPFLLLFLGLALGFFLSRLSRLSAPDPEFLPLLGDLDLVLDLDFLLGLDLDLDLLFPRQRKDENPKNKKGKNHL